VLVPPKITKADLARYYEAVAETMLPHIRDRPLNLERYPDGIGHHKIMQQHASSHFPAWIKRATVPKKGGTVEHVVANDSATLVYLANQAALTLHCWPSRVDRLDRPDRLIFDLDPSIEDAAAVKRAARIIASLLAELGCTPHAMTSGSRGYHIVVALKRTADYDEVRAFAQEVAELAVARDPAMFTVEQRKAKREQKILIDVQRNGYAHTAVAPYSVRPKPNAPVAMPLHLEELEDRATSATRWTIKTAIKRLASEGDAWRALKRDAVALGSARQRLAEALAEI
jgi:bifunctional non-homologous end joining protein LigD